MKALRTVKIKGVKIEEFYWAGKYVVYVDNRLFEGDFETAMQKELSE